VDQRQLGINADPVGVVCNDNAAAPAVATNVCCLCRRSQHGLVSEQQLAQAAVAAARRRMVALT
jgi:hypothetical protein